LLLQLRTDLKLSFRKNLLLLLLSGVEDCYRSLCGGIRTLHVYGFWLSPI